MWYELFYVFLCMYDTLLARKVLHSIESLYPPQLMEVKHIHRDGRT
jgi:hypothetical protein